MSEEYPPRPVGSEKMGVLVMEGGARDPRRTRKTEFDEKSLNREWRGEDPWG